MMGVAMFADAAFTEFVETKLHAAQAMPNIDFFLEL